MNGLLIALAGLFGFAGAISAILASVSFTRRDLRKHPLLRFSTHKVPLFLVTVLFWAIAGVTGAMGTLTTSQPSLRTIQGPGGETVEIATSEGFRKEADHSASSSQLGYIVQLPTYNTIPDTMTPEMGTLFAHSVSVDVPVHHLNRLPSLTQQLQGTGCTKPLR